MSEFQYPDHEWLYLQSYLINIFSAYQPFCVLLEHADAHHVPYTRTHASHFWFPVQAEIEIFLHWSHHIENIGKPLTLQEDITGQKYRGEKWAIDIALMHNEFNFLFVKQTKQRNNDHLLSGHSVIFRKIRYLSGMDALWWNRLLDTTRRYRSILLGHIHDTQVTICNLDTEAGMILHERD